MLTKQPGGPLIQSALPHAVSCHLEVHSRLEPYHSDSFSDKNTFSVDRSYGSAVHLLHADTEHS
jgi:hypothetical protein